MRGENIDRLLIAVVQREQRAGAAGVTCSFQSRLLRECTLEWRSHQVAPQERHGCDQRVAVGAGGRDRAIVKLECRIVPALDLWADPRAVDASEKVLRAVLDELVPAAELDREGQWALLGRLKMVCDAIKVGEGLVDRGGSVSSDLRGKPFLEHRAHNRILGTEEDH